MLLAFSPCPNDTFIFDALVHGRVDTEGLRFRPVLADVEELNRAAFAKTYPVTKLSYLTVAQVQDRYRVLDSGGALGEGVGPLLIADRARDPDELRALPVAIPGLNTTANFLLRFAYPALTDLRPMLFSDIERAIHAGEVAAGAIIHESRFTYAERGFTLLRDLGEHWTAATGTPIPLGGICVARDLAPGLQAAVARCVRRSVEFAMAHPEASRDYVRAHAQEMSPAVQRQHIATYVNEYARSLGPRGRAGVVRLIDEAAGRGMGAALVDDLFV